MRKRSWLRFANWAIVGCLLTPTASWAQQAVTSFTLVNAETDADIRTIVDGDVLELGSLPGAINIRANTDPPVVGSVLFTLGSSPRGLVENEAPYALAGDRDGQYKAWRAPLGTHTLTATPFTGVRTGGAEGLSLTIQFSVVDSLPEPAPEPEPTPEPEPAPSDLDRVVRFVLVDATNDVDLFELFDGQTLSIDELPDVGLSIRAETDPPIVGSVRFGLNSATVYRTESVAPYTLGGDSAGDYNPVPFGLGMHTVTAVPFTGSGGTGEPGESAALTFTLTESGSPPPTPSASNPGAVTAIELFDPATGQSLGALVPGDLIDLSSFAGQVLGFRAISDSFDTSSVAWLFNGVSTAVDSSAPFELVLMIPVGIHTVSATPFSEPAAAGAIGTTRTVSFEGILSTGGSEPPPSVPVEPEPEPATPDPEPEPVAPDPVVPDPIDPEAILAVGADSTHVITGPVGGPFAPQALSLSVENTGSAPLRWRGHVTADWLSLSPPLGVLAPGESTEVLVSVGAPAGLLESGAHVAQVMVVDMGGHAPGVSVSVRLEVGDASGSGTTYFVDFDGGSDSSDGRSPDNAWKHHPWDDQATGVAGSTSLQPGDEVILKGGVHYRGVLNASDSGSLSSPIVLDGNTRGTFGEGRAIIDGSEVLTGWTAAGGGLYWTTLPGVANDVYRCNLFAGERLLGLSQGPTTPADRYHFDDLEEMRAVPPSQVTSTSITDPGLFSTLPSDFWVGAHVAVWAKPNFIYFKEITSYDASAGRITFGSVDPYHDRDTKYAILNSEHFLDSPGEYVIDTASGTVLLWPESPEDLNQVTASVRTYGIDLNGRDHLTVRGIRFLKQSAGLDMSYQGIAIRSLTSYGTDGAVIQGNEVAYNRSMSRSGAITIAHGTGCSIDGNFIHHNFRNRGIIVTYGESQSLIGNLLYANGGTGIYCSLTNNSLLEGNQVLRHTGTHGNGISLYTDCHNCLITRNQVLEGNIAITTKGSYDLVISHNVFSVDESLNGFTVADWGGSVGLTYLHNVIRSHSNQGFFLGTSSQTGATVQNCVIDGLLVPHTAITNSHNIYTGLSWMQDESDLGPHDFMATASDVFIDPTNQDFRLAPASPAIDAGLMLEEGTYAGSAPDIGAHELGL